MDDLTLMYRAAIAAGYDVKRMCDPVESGEPCSEFLHVDGKYWNPLECNDDANRLAFDLEVSFTVKAHHEIPDIRRLIVEAASALWDAHLNEQEELEKLTEENKALRKALQACAAAVGAQADASCSVEFMQEIPKEVAAVVERFKWAADAPYRREVFGGDGSGNIPLVFSHGSAMGKTEARADIERALFDALNLKK